MKLKMDQKDKNGWNLSFPYLERASKLLRHLSPRTQQLQEQI